MTVSPTSLQPPPDIAAAAVDVDAQTRPSQNSRKFGLDILRILACYMVIQVHSGEFFYIAPAGILHGPGNFAVTLYSSLCRASVPLFVMISGFFLLPVVETGSSFFKRKLTRVLYPFVLWCAIYAFASFFTGRANLVETCTNILKIPLNYGTEVGHLWYIYMLLGIYLFAPVISPWLLTASRRAIEFYLVLWAITGLVPYLHLLFPEIWGECYWNSTPTLFYFSGLLGYAVLGCYLKKFHGQRRRLDIPLGLALILAGYLVTALGFAQRLHTATSVSALELTWQFNTLNVAMIALGFFLLFKNVTVENANTWPARLVQDVSVKSYGMYLAHILLLNKVHSFLGQTPTNPLLLLPLMASITFIASYLLVKALSYLPKSKLLIG